MEPSSFLVFTLLAVVVDAVPEVVSVVDAVDPAVGAVVVPSVDDEVVVGVAVSSLLPLTQCTSCNLLLVDPAAVLVVEESPVVVPRGVSS